MNSLWVVDRRSANKALLNQISNCAYWQFVAGLPLGALRVARHDHPLQVDGSRPQRVCLLGDDDLAVQIDAAVHVLHRLLTGRFAIYVEHHSACGEFVK